MYCFLIAQLALLVLILHGAGIGWVVNQTASAPQGVFMRLPFSGPPQADQWVGFVFPHAAWAVARGYIKPGEKGMKKIKAVPGMYLFTDHQRIYACHGARRDAHCQLLGVCQGQDHQHRPMHCQDWQGERIPSGWYYLGSRRVANSFDSRYVGLVARSDVLYRIDVGA
jgi:type IV secretory pathway protease TraF